MFAVCHGLFTLFHGVMGILDVGFMLWFVCFLWVHWRARLCTGCHSLFAVALGVIDMLHCMLFIMVCLLFLLVSLIC